VLLPLSIVASIFFVSQGVIQNLSPNVQATMMEPYRAADGGVVLEQTIPMGPVASQEAIKMIGTNGGGYFNANSAHPFENPTPLSNFIEILLMALIPAGLTYTFGKMVKGTRQGWAIYIAMMIVFCAALDALAGLGAMAIERIGSNSMS
jgi:K+-transporting ATPase ATPase A chain